MVVDDEKYAIPNPFTVNAPIGGAGNAMVCKSLEYAEPLSPTDPLINKSNVSGSVLGTTGNPLTEY
jgi:hypothetical protein